MSRTMPLELQSTRLISTRMVLSGVSPHVLVTVNEPGDYILPSQAPAPTPGKARRMFLEAGAELTLWCGQHIYEASSGEG